MTAIVSSKKKKQKQKQKKKGKDSLGLLVASRVISLLADTSARPPSATVFWTAGLVDFWHDER